MLGFVQRHPAFRNAGCRTTRKWNCVFNIRLLAEIGGAGSSRNSISGVGFTFNPAYLPLVYRPRSRSFPRVSPIANSLYMFSRADYIRHRDAHIQRNTISARAMPPQPYSQHIPSRPPGREARFIPGNPCATTPDAKSPGRRVSRERPGEPPRPGLICTKTSYGIRVAVQRIPAVISWQAPPKDGCRCSLQKSRDGVSPLSPSD